MGFWNGKSIRSDKKLQSLGGYIKIVFFDGISISDYLKIKFGGERAFEIADIGKTSTNLGAGSELSGQAGGQTRAAGGLFVGSSLIAKIRRQSSREKNSTLKNTSLTDYLDLVKNDENINVFDGYVLAPYAQSLTHLKMIAPYVSIIDGKIPVDGANGMHLDLKSFDKSLTGARGYFEMMASKVDHQNVVLRFNSEAFHNNYSLYDITKMDLVFHAIKVGVSKEVDLSLVDEINKIAGITVEESPIPNDGFMDIAQEDDAADTVGQKQSKELDVYDVVFAGVVSKK